MAIRASRRSCTGCPVREMVDEGMAAPAGACDPDGCELAAYQALPSAALWSWFAELLCWESSGLVPVQQLVLEWSLHHIRAFVAFRAAIVELETELARKEAEAHGC